MMLTKPYETSKSGRSGHVTVRNQKGCTHFSNAFWATDQFFFSLINIKLKSRTGGRFYAVVSLAVLSPGNERRRERQQCNYVLYTLLAQKQSRVLHHILAMSDKMGGRDSHATSQSRLRQLATINALLAQPPCQCPGPTAPSSARYPNHRLRRASILTDLSLS
jgi:hypothetical protein